jgi:UDP-N-acetylmuramoyl-tripeptide--D-alanyl-D-alanine ligase
LNAEAHAPPPFRSLEARSIGEVRSWIGARGGETFDARPFGRISTDSRSLAPGEVFLALRGENFDGHAYARDAVERGAAA